MSDIDPGIVRQVLYALIEQVELDKPTPYWSCRWGDSDSPEAITGWLLSLLDANWQPPPSGLMQLADAIAAMVVPGQISAVEFHKRLTASGWIPPQRGAV